MNENLNDYTGLTDLDSIIARLRTSHWNSTGGTWGKGRTTHHTVSNGDGRTNYEIAEFHHADDAQFCDDSHALVPILCNLAEQYRDMVEEQISVWLPPEKRAELQTHINQRMREALNKTVVSDHQIMVVNSPMITDDMLRDLMTPGRIIAVDKSQQPTFQFIGADFSVDSLRDARNDGIEMAAKLVDQRFDEQEPWICGDDVRALKEPPPPLQE